MNRTPQAAGSSTVGRLVRPSVVHFVDEYHFILPALAWAYKHNAFSVAFGWWRWHVELTWPNESITGGR